MPTAGTPSQFSALGVPTNCTSGYSVPQFIAVAEAVQAGLLAARRAGVELTGWRSVITYMSARWEAAPDFSSQAKAAGVELSPEDIRWAGVAIFKHAYRIFRQRAYPTLKEAAEFFLDYLVEHPTHGWLVTGPSTSPNFPAIRRMAIPFSGFSQGIFAALISW